MIKFVVTFINVKGNRCIAYVEAKNTDEAVYHFMAGHKDVLTIISIKEKV